LHCYIQAHGNFASADIVTLLRNFGRGGYGSRQARLTCGIEGIGHVPGDFPGYHQNDVEADEALRVGGVMRQPELGGAQNAPFAAFGHRFGGFVSAIARFHFDEYERVPPASHDINLAEGRFEAARGDPVALGHEQHGGAAFCGKAEPESGYAVAFWFPPRWWLCGPDHGAGCSFASASARR
jgi:hypothetical protein